MTLNALKPARRGRATALTRPGSDTRPRRLGLASLALAGAVLACPTAGLANDSGYHYQFIPLGGYTFGGEFDEIDSDATVELDDDSSFGFILGGRDTRKTQWEVFYTHQETTGDTSLVPGLPSSTDLTLQTLQLGGSYHGDGDLVRPFLSAAIGGTHFSPDATGLDNDTFWSFSIGTGLELFNTERIGLRLEARALGSVIDPDADLFCASGGNGAICAFRLEGNVLWQFQAFAGLVIRF
jgi:hypothetical protein